MKYLGFLKNETLQKLQNTKYSIELTKTSPITVNMLHVKQDGKLPLRPSLSSNYSTGFLPTKSSVHCSLSGITTEWGI